MKLTEIILTSWEKLLEKLSELKAIIKEKEKFQTDVTNRLLDYLVT
jgi:hypothetical protein